MFDLFELPHLRSIKNCVIWTEIIINLQKYYNLFIFFGHSIFWGQSAITPAKTKVRVGEKKK